MKKIIGWTLIGLFLSGICVLSAVNSGLEWWWGLVIIGFVGFIGIFFWFCMELITSDE